MHAHSFIKHGLLFGVATWMSLNAAPLAHAQECALDDDCPAGMACDIAPSASLPCAGGDCPDAAQPLPEGRCEPQPIECEQDTECPEGLRCAEEQDRSPVGVCSSTPGGEPMCGELGDPEPTTSICSFVLDDCTSDDDCTQAGYACISLDEGSGSEKSCFPARVDCDSDADCSDDWSCFTLPEDSRESAPPAYVGASSVCFPDGFVMALNDEIKAGNVAPPGSDDSAKESPSSASADDDDASMSSDGGCAVSQRHGGASGTVLAFLAALGLLVRRRI